MTPDTSHYWFAEQIASYLTDGLDAEERARFEAHADQCASCAAKLAQAKNDDAMLLELFERIGPSADFEDRVIRGLRGAEPAKFGFRPAVRLHPMVFRAARVTAAAVLLAGLGYGGLSLMQNRRAETVAMSAATPTMDEAASLPTTQPSFSYANPIPGQTAPGRGYKMVRGLDPTFAVSADINPNPQHGKDGQNALYGKGHVDFQNNPFVGTSRDNIYNRGANKVWGTSSQDLIGSPYVANDSVLLPTDDNDGGDNSPAQQQQMKKEDERTRAGEAAAANQLVDKLAKRNVSPISPATPDYSRPSDGGATAGLQQQVAASLHHRVDANGMFQSIEPAPTSPATGHEMYFKPAGDRDAALAAQQEQKEKTQQQIKNMTLAMDTERQKTIADLKQSPGGESSTPTPVPQTPAPQTAPPAQTPETAPADSSRKIIRNGEMSFQVDSFDSAFMQITKIAAEEGGFVADTESEKLPNGKMSGTVTVRVPPDHLDTLTLKLRALGDLTGQKINAQDVTKEYTDLESELRAAKAMEDRLLEIIKTGNGQVKDLVAAEREVGVWREKVEKVTGEINYYNNLISLSTLRLTLEERDIRRAALASEKEMVDMGIETPDVEKARADAMHALDDAKARIIQADLKKLDAGQLAATIVADVSPDAAGPVIDHFKQFGRVARMNIERQQTVAEGATVPPGVKVDRLDTRLQVSLYNLANVSPRQTTNITMACPDVESAYHAIIGKIVDAGGRVVDSSLNRVKPDQTDGSITFETPKEKADLVLAAVRGLGEVMHLAVTENPDAANVTTAKEGFSISLASEAIIPSRETIVTTLMPTSAVADAYHAILQTVQKNHGNVTTAQLQEQNSQSDSATLIFDIGRDDQPVVEKTITDAIGASGRVIARQSSRSNDTEHTLDSKVQFSMTFCSADALQARETVARVLAVEDVSGTYAKILAAAQQAGAKVVTANEDQSNPSNPSGQLDFVIARSQTASVEKAISEAKGGTISRSVARSADMNATTDEKVELRLAIGDLSQLPPRQTTTMNVEASDPESASSNLQAAVLAGGGRIVEQHLVKDDRYQAHLVVEVPLSKGSDFIDQVRDAGMIQTIERTEDQTVPAADFAQAKLDITLNATSAIVGPQAGLWAGLKGGLGASIRGLAYSFELIVIGICLALPWGVLGWAGWKMVRRLRRKAPIVR